MPGFTKDAFRTPFGRNVYLRSTRDVKTESYTVYNASVPAFTIDTFSNKILQPGTVMARITSGAGIGKIGPFQGGGATNERASIAVDATGGTFTITWGGATTAAIAFNASDAAVKAAFVAATAAGNNDVIVTGGPGSAGGATPYVIEFTGAYANEDVSALTTTPASLTGGAGTAVVTTTAGGSGTATGATDGRGDITNIVGINNTFLPWQLLERDVEVAIVYEASVVQAWCLELNAAGSAYVALSNSTANAMNSNNVLHFLFK